MTPSVYLAVAGRSPQQHATFPRWYKELILTEKVLLQYYDVPQSTTPYNKMLLQYYSSTTKVLLQYYKVLLCTTKYYSVLQSTTPVLQNTTPLLQNTTPLLLRATQYYSSTVPYYSVLQDNCKGLFHSTTLYYKVLLRTTKYNSVLQSNTPVLTGTTPHYKVLLCTTKNCKVLFHSTTLYYKVLQCITLY